MAIRKAKGLTRGEVRSIEGNEREDEGAQELAPVAEKRLPRKPPEPSPYPERADHAAETGEAAQLKEDYMKEFQQTWKDVMEMTKSGTFTAPKRRSGLVVAVSVHLVKSARR